MNLHDALQGYELSSLEAGFSPLTIDAYTSSLKLLVDYLHNPEVEQISETDLMRFFGYLRTKYKPAHSKDDELSTASIHRYWKAVRSFFKWSSSPRGLGTGRPDINFAMPRYNNSEIIPYSEADVQALLKASQLSAPVRKKDKAVYQFKIHTGVRDYAIMLFLLDTGLRPGELCRLKLSEVNLKNGEIQVRPHRIGKTRPRVVIIENKARTAVWRYLKDRPEAKDRDPLFVTDEGHEMTRYTLGSMVARTGERAGVADANPYRFRHTFAIQYLRNGGDAYTLQRLLGHATMEMVRNYLRLSQVDAQEAHKRASPVERWRL
jgi:integrase/recombinase XerD